ncbi:MAG: ion transporter [Chthoniobacterales bacterium]
MARKKPILIYDHRGLVTFGKWELLFQFFIIFSVVGFAIDTLPDLGPSWRKALKFSEVLSILIFTVEYFLRLYYSKSRWTYITSFFGIIDLLAILPFYLLLGYDMRSIRILQFARVMRIFKMARYNTAARRFQHAFIIAKEELILFGLTALATLYLSAIGIYFFEHTVQPEKFGTIFNCVWWAAVTLTTVGYGDAYPITEGGKAFTFLMLIIGVGIVAIPTALLAAAISRVKEEELLGRWPEKESDSEKDAEKK